MPVFLCSLSASWFHRGRFPNALKNPIADAEARAGLDVIVRAIAARFPSGMLYSAREAVTAVELGSRLNPSN
jgi:hypothetical protein